MSRAALKTLAVILSLLIVVVLFAGFDDLPRGVRARIDAEQAAFASAQKQVQAARDGIGRDFAAEPALFQAIHTSREWPVRLDRAGADLQAAGRDMDELSKLEKQNRRGDRDRAESLMAHERGLRTGALASAAAVQAEAARWLGLKQKLPQALQDMERQRKAIDGYDLSALSAAVQRAGNDWPEKKAGLESRLAGVRGLVAQSDEVWQTSADARSRAAAGDPAAIPDVAAAVDAIETSGRDFPAKTEELKSLTGQLYTSWDKVLVDLEVRGRGDNRSYDQKIRTIQMRVSGPADKSGQATSEEKWVEVPRATYEARKNDLGMSIEHKAAGKYDSEAERVAQPAGFAYMASPAQGSNQYGRWEHRDGRDFWVFYGQYALLRDLLFNRDYRPLDRGDWEGYRTSRDRGQTYYGNDTSTGGQKYGSQGSTTQQRYSGSSYDRSGGFRDSKYASKSGSYRDSEYASPSARQGGDSSPRSFGRSSRQDEPHAAPPPSRSYRPAPRPTYRSPMRSSPGRSFGRRR